MPKVTIVIPVYNVEQYLRECLESAVNQTLREIEILCINDGSTDRSLDIANKYAEKDSRVRVISKENGGLSSARNCGLSAATGEYIYFLDSDDYIDVEAMETLYNLAIREDLDVVYFDGLSFYENADLEDSHDIYKNYYIRPATYDKVYSGQQLFTEMNLKNEYRQSACLQMIKVRHLSEKKLSFYEGILHEDNLFSFLCIMQANRVMHLSAPFFHRRIRGSSIMTQDEDARNFVGYFTCLAESLAFLSNRLCDDAVQNAVNKYISGLLSNARRIFNSLSDEGRRSVHWNGNAYRECLFALLIKRPEHELKKLRKEIDGLRKETAVIRRSFSYRIGRLLTLIPRKMIRFLRRK